MFSPSSISGKLTFSISLLPFLFTLSSLSHILSLSHYTTFAILLLYPLSSLSPSPPPLCGAIPASSDYVAKQGDKVAARVKAVDGDEQWILAEVVSYSHSTNK